MSEQIISTSVPFVRLELDRGSETSIPILFTAADGTSVIQLVTLGYAIRAAFRQLDGGAVLLSLTNTNSRLVLANVDPNIRMLIAATDTTIGSAFDGIRSGIWDMYGDPQGVENANSFRILGGGWTMGPQVTP